MNESISSTTNPDEGTFENHAVQWNKEALQLYAIGQPPEGMESIKMLMAAMQDQTPPEKPKAATYLDALREQQERGTAFTGIDQDEDVADLPEQLHTIFGKELFDECLVSKIAYYPDVVLLAREGQHYAVPPENYRTLLAANPQLSDHRFRAFSSANFNLHPAMKRYERTPIAIYSFAEEPLSDKNYLPEGDSAAQRRAYKIGTVVHEVAHHLWSNVLSDDQRASWRQVNEQAMPLTAYAASYAGKDAWAAEQFGEAVRLRATNSQYLQAHSSIIDAYLARELPQINEARL
ncbi:MAG TPA: hypothetical protein VK978_03935 [Candidatus Saccharimonadales bacterium]|nr:hypothetical protein [Candidatus Saccharimonadales bacterium]